MWPSEMNNCLANYDLAQCARHILVKLDGDAMAFHLRSAPS